MAEQKQPSAWQLTEAFLPFMTGGVLLLNGSGFVKFANQTAEIMLGAENTGVIGEPGERFLPAALLKLPGALHHYKTVLTQLDGRSIPTSVSIIPLGKAGKEDKLISMMYLTELQQAENALLHTQRLAGLGTLAASVAHELTNPLSIITATCSNLIHEVNNDNMDGEMLLHYIRMIEHSAWRSTRIVEVLRHYAHNTGLETAVTNLNMIVEDALTLVQPQLRKEHKVRIHANLAEDLPSIVCDHNRLTQVLVNLLHNARDAMPPDGGEIYVRTWAVANDSGQGGEQVAVSVRDEGRGVPPELLEQIFTPFFTTKLGGSGAGLGLFVARKVVEQHNGRIWAENHPEGGAVFTVVLPQK